MRLTRLHVKTNPAGEAGFSMVEAIVSAGLLTVSTVALMGVLNSTLTSVKNINSRDEGFVAINADMANVQRMNDYYTCIAGNCSVSNLNQDPPTKYQYAPSPSDPTAFATFSNLCKNTPSNLSQALVDTLGASTSITANGGSVDITRTATLHPGNGSNQHLYIVEWIPPQGAKTQIVLAPTVSQWCP